MALCAAVAAAQDQATTPGQTAPGAGDNQGATPSGAAADTQAATPSGPARPPVISQSGSTSPPASAQSGSTSPPASALPAEVTSATPPAPLVVWDHPIATFRVRYAGATPKERAAAAATRIDALLDELKPESISFSSIQIDRERGIVLLGGAHILFGLLRGDLPQDGVDTLERAGLQAVERLQQMLRDRTEQRSIREILWDLVQTGLATLVALGLWRVVYWLRSQVFERLQRLPTPRTEALERMGLHVRPLVRGSITWLVLLTSLGLTLAIGYVWLAFVLSRFPLTRPWGEKLGTYLVETLGQLALNAVAQIPDLITLVVILLITRAVARLVDGWFTSVAQGTFTISWLSPDAARVTRRLGIVAVWLFALTAAYPYIPGSQTNVFKGATVFVGLLISLASQGILNQVLSGLVVVHTGALRRGDHVRIGEVIGTVVEVGMVATRINTIVQEEVTVPNAVIVTTSISNYSRRGAQRGVVLSAGVTIGYDVPWRQVHALLEEAASRTPGIRKSPKPYVLQSTLSDFYVEYRVYFQIDRADDRPFVVSSLNAAIQDAFNARGVQIMSPHYMVQPAQPFTVPQEKWFAAPARNETDSGFGTSSSA